MSMLDQTISQDAAAQADYEQAPPLMLSFAPNWPVRTVLFRVIGTALILSASGMWVLPGSQVDGDVVFIKLGVSIFFFMCGLALLMRNHADNRPDAYFDPVRGEVRVLQKNDRGRPQTVLRRSYDSLGTARFSDHMVELYDMDGTMLMRVPLASADIRQALRMQLSGRVQLTN